MALQLILGGSGQGKTDYLMKEIIRESGVKIGQNIFSYKDSEIKKAILKNNPYITDVTISRQLPNRFLITVEEHTPVAAVKYNGK